MPVAYPDFGGGGTKAKLFEQTQWVRVTELHDDGEILTFTVNFQVKFAISSVDILFTHRF